MIIVITPGMNITISLIQHHGCFFFIEKDKRNNIKRISYVRLCLFTDACLLALKKYFRKLYLRSTVGQTRLSSIAIIHIERFTQTALFRYRWIQLLIFFEKEKNRKSFMRSVHILIILLYNSLRRLVQWP